MDQEFKPEILDCTFRDGGYYTKWYFEESLVASYLNAIKKTGIKYVEIGFRSNHKNGFYGPYVYSTDKLLSELPIDGLNIGVMINGKEFYDNDVSLLFNDCSKSPVSFVRVAINFVDYKNVESVVKKIKNLGYMVCINLMQAAGKSLSDLSNAVTDIKNWNAVDTIYFADSFGNMDTQEVTLFVNKIRDNWDGDIGMHAHNNKDIATYNSICAFKNGARFIDGTMLGMGRGAGNAKTEYLLKEFDHVGYDPEPIYDIVLNEFSKLQNEYKWGPNLIYYLAASYDIHPTYVQEMSALMSYDNNKMMDGIFSLRNIDAKSYSKNILHNAISGEIKDYDGNVGPITEIDKNILIVGSGPSSKKYKDDINKFIKNNQPFVINLNWNTSIDRDLINIYASCNHARLAAESCLYGENDTLLAPKNLCNNTLANVIDYGFSLVDHVRYHKSRCEIPNLLSFPYALCFALAYSRPKYHIYLVGFDGFNSNDDRQVEMSSIIAKFKEVTDRELISLTPTSYEVQKSSLFSPLYQ